MIIFEREIFDSKIWWTFHKIISHITITSSMIWSCWAYRTPVKSVRNLTIGTLCIFTLSLKIFILKIRKIIINSIKKLLTVCIIKLNIIIGKQVITSPASHIIICFFNYDSAIFVFYFFWLCFFRNSIFINISCKLFFFCWCTRSNKQTNKSDCWSHNNCSFHIKYSVFVFILYI